MAKTRTCRGCGHGRPGCECQTQDLEEEWHTIQCHWNEEPYGPAGNDLPAVLYDSCEEGLFHHDRYDLFAYAAIDAWGSASFPCQSVNPAQWVGWFREVGFTRNGIWSPRPARVPTLWRVQSADDAVRGMSWTDNRKVAEAFVRINTGRYGRDTIVLRTDDVRREDALARIYGVDQRDEDEWIIDPNAPFTTRIVAREGAV